MDDFESRLSEGLGNQADHLPTFNGDLRAVRRRGRNRRIAARGAGTIGALAVVGGGLVLLTTLQSEPPQIVATETPLAVASPTAEPTPTPPPAPTPIATPIASDSLPPPAATPGPNDASLLVATGWGVGLVNSTTALFAPIACCEADGYQWWDQSGLDVDGQHIDEGALTVRDDLRGGLVTASSNGLFWMPPARMSDGLPPLTIDSGEGLRLWDVAEVDGLVQVLYSTTGGETATLFAKTLDGFAEQNPSRVVESQTQAAITGASWLSDGGWLTLKSANQGACSWVELTPSTGSASDLASPLPKPDDSATCENLSIAVGTLDDAGTLLATSEQHPDRTPELAIYDLATKTEEWRTELPSATDGQGSWSEIDFIAPQVLLSRGAGMDSSLWSSLDETVLVDIETGDISPRPFFGALSFPHRPVSTAGLTALDPVASPLRFTLEGAVPEPTPEPIPEPTETPTPKPTPIVLTAGQLPGDDTCLELAGFTTCIGGGFQTALADAEAVFGPSDNDDPAVFSEGEPPPSTETIWLLDNSKIILVNDGDSVSEIRVFPTSDPLISQVFGGSLTIGSVLKTLGEPADVFNGGGEGQQVLWLNYETNKGRISYGFTEFWGDDQLLLDEGDLTIPESYLSLPVNSYWALPGH